MNRKITFLLLFLTATGIGAQSLKMSIINSPPPPANYQPPPEVKSTTGTWIYVDDNRNSFPAYLWSYGCAPTSVSMIVAFYDRNGYPCMYQGTINGGVAPPYNSSWTEYNLPVAGVPNAFYTNYKNSISASMKGFDGRTINGNVDDFWVEFGKSNNDPHPYIGDTPPHDFTISPCVADYMGTSQDYYNNYDGGTTIYYNPDNTKLYDLSSVEQRLPRTRDITHGLKEFFEKGVQEMVTAVYSQPIYGADGIAQGFTFPELMQEIDQGRPVLVHFDGHTAVCIGYNAAEKKIALYDTWSTTKNKIKWGDPLVDGHGTSYCMKGVTVLELYGNFQKTKSALKSTCSVAVGPFDKVTISEPTNGTMPPNTTVFWPGGNISFYAYFTSYYNNTYPVQWDWKIELYHNSGTYIYTQDSYSSTINSYRWSKQVPVSLPNYDWILENGFISGKVIVSVKISDGYVKTDEIRIGVNNCSKSIENITYTQSTTVSGCYISVKNVNIQNNSNVIFDASDCFEMGGPFEVQSGSSFEVK